MARIRYREYQADTEDSADSAGSRVFAHAQCLLAVCCVTFNPVRCMYILNETHCFPRLSNYNAVTCGWFIFHRHLLSGVYWRLQVVYSKFPVQNSYCQKSVEHTDKCAYANVCPMESHAVPCKSWFHSVSLLPGLQVQLITFSHLFKWIYTVQHSVNVLKHLVAPSAL